MTVDNGTCPDYGCTELSSETERPGFVVRINGKLRIQGYMELLMHYYEMAREINSELPIQCPSEYFDPVCVARLFNIPEEELDSSSKPTIPIK